MSIPRFFGNYPLTYDAVKKLKINQGERSSWAKEQKEQNEHPMGSTVASWSSRKPSLTIGFLYSLFLRTQPSGSGDFGM